MRIAAIRRGRKSEDPSTLATNASSAMPPRYAMTEPMNSVVSAIPSMIFTPFLSDHKIAMRGKNVCESSYEMIFSRSPAPGWLLLVGGRRIPLCSPCGNQIENIDLKRKKFMAAAR